MARIAIYLAAASGVLNLMSYVQPAVVAALPSFVSLSLYAVVVLFGLPLFFRLRRHYHLWKRYAATGNDPIGEPTVPTWFQWMTLGSVLYAFGLTAWFVLTLDGTTEAGRSSVATADYIAYRARIDRTFSANCAMWALGLSWGYQVLFRPNPSFVGKTHYEPREARA